MGRVSPPAALEQWEEGLEGVVHPSAVSVPCVAGRIPRKARGGKEGGTQFSQSVLGSVGLGSRLGVRFCFTFQSMDR